MFVSCFRTLAVILVLDISIKNQSELCKTRSGHLRLQAIYCMQHSLRLRRPLGDEHVCAKSLLQYLQRFNKGMSMYVPNPFCKICQIFNQEMSTYVPSPFCKTCRISNVDDVADFEDLNVNEQACSLVAKAWFD